MKLLLVTSLKESQKAVAVIMKQAGIEVFSKSETIGFKNYQETNMLGNWFGSEQAQFDSVFLFSFTSEANAEKALELIKKHNSENETGFPIRAFVIPVEKASYSAV